MSNEDFEALVALINSLIYYEIELGQHPNDQPRNARMIRERDEAIEAARERLVL